MQKISINNTIHLSLVGSLTRPINPQIPTARETEVLEQEAALKVLIGVQNRVEFAGAPEVFVFDLLLSFTVSKGAKAVI
jgi:hypothetical protein